MNAITHDDFMATTMARSDQINADDLLGGPLTCQITAIEMTGSADQPVSIYVDAHPQPWKPSKTSRRVLAACWSDVEPSQWVGRFVVLCNDPTVTWGGEAVGGIRTSHLSHIGQRKSIAVNVKRGKKAAQIIEPYYPQQQQAAEPVYWPDDKFEIQYARAEPALLSGEKLADDIIAALEKKALLSAGQKARLRRCTADAPETEESAPDHLLEDGDPFAEQDQ